MKTFSQFLDTPIEEDKKWIQKATKNMRKDKPCTGEKFGSETCPPGSKRYNLAKTFKKMAKEEVAQDDPALNSKQKRATQIKKQVLMKKLQAVRAGSEDIVASHTLDGDMVEGYQRNPERDTRSARQRRMDDPDTGINSAKFRAFMAAQQKPSKPKKKVDEATDKAFEYVKKQIAAKYGKSGYVSKDNPRKPQTAAEKAKVRAHQAKVDKENAAARAKDPSQGRYPKG